MALLFCDSFNHYNNANGAAGDMAKKWTALGVPNNASSASDQDIPGGGFEYDLGIGSQIQAAQTLPSNYATGVLGCWFKFTGTQYPIGVNVELLTFAESGTPQVSVCVGSNGQLFVARNGVNGTSLAGSPKVIPLNVWFHLEFKATIHNTTGIIEVRVDGSSADWIPQLTGQNTRQTANAYFNSARFTAGNNMTARARGFYVLDTSGTVGNDFLGPCRVACLRPIGKGNYSQWTPSSSTADNFHMVGEMIPSSGGIHAVSTATVNNIDTYEFEDAPIPSGTVVGIQHVILTNRDAAGARTIAPVQRSSGTDYVGTTSAALTTTTTYVREVKAQNPATTANWTLSDLNGAEFGYKLIS